MILFGRRLSRVVLHKKLVPIGICFGVILSLTAVPFMGCQQRKPSTPTDSYSAQRGLVLSASGRQFPEDDEDFEPALHLDTRRKTSQANSPEKVVLIRPRFYSTELEIREKLLVAVLTSPETIDTFGAAVNRTLSRHPNKLVYFSCTSDGEVPSTLRAPSVVNFAGVNCDALVSHVLRHLSSKNVVKDFDFLFLMRDSTYVNGDKLVGLATRVSVNGDAFIGRTSDAGLCDIDAGILLSNGVFRKAVAGLDGCIDGTDQLSDDRIGECIAKASGVPCSDSYQGQAYYALNLEKDLGYVPDPATLVSRKDFGKVVTVYPVLSFKYHYRLHHHFSHFNLQKVHRQISLTEKLIADVAVHMPKDFPGRPDWPLGVEAPLKPSNRFDVARCIYFNDTHMLWKNDNDVISPITGSEKLSLDDLKHSAAEFLKKLYKTNLTIVNIMDGYKKFDPTRGLSYMMHLLLRDQDSNTELQKTLEFLRPLGKSEILPMPYVTEHTRVVMVLFVKENELDHVVVFIEEYAKTCLEKNDNTMLLLAFLQPMDTPDAFGNIRSFALSSSNRFRRSSAKLATISIRIPKDRRIPSDFALMDLVVRKLPQDSLVLLCQTGMELRTDYLNRVRMNTIAGVQVFLPIPFTQFHPVITEQEPPMPEFLELKRENGFFDSNNFKHFSFYVSDYWHHRTLIAKEVPLAHSSTDLTAAHYHDLTFGIVELFLVSKELHLLRAVEPDLRLYYIWRNCDSEPNLRAAENCKLSRLNSVGNRGQQARFLLSQVTGKPTRASRDLPPGS